MPLRTETYTLLGLLVFILAFFPGLFHSIWTVPLSLLPLASRFSGSAVSRTCTTTYAAAPACQTPSVSGMSWFQKQFSLAARSRGSYLITDQVTKALPEIAQYKVGLLHLFIQHTSCAIGMNENWDDEVRADMSDAMDRLVPEDRKGNLYRHAAEGPDDMPAHIKAALIGSSVTIPIKNGALATGTWQGIWYFEFRTSKHQRNIVATIQGEKMH